MESALYLGSVHHRRHTDGPHAFRVRLAMLYLDLSELPQVFSGRWLAGLERPAWLSFRRRDYLGDPAQPLDEAVRDLVAARTGGRPAGPVRLLTWPRTLGLCFNPVSFYYCFDGSGRRLEALVAEVTNTPWNERHCYVLPVERALRRGPVLRWQGAKQFHVSPFLGMDMDYHWAVREPGARLGLAIANQRQGERLFDATLVLARRPLDRRALAGALLRFPLAGGRVLAHIYLQALRLALRGAPFHSHPRAGADARREEVTP